MSKPGADPSSGIGLGDELRLPKRHPACRRREAQSGSCTERENLAGDAKGKGASGSNREAESTDAPDPASKNRLLEITSGSCRGQQGLVTTCKDSPNEAKSRRRREPNGSGG